MARGKSNLRSLAAARDDDEGYGKVVAALRPIREARTSRIDVRVLERDGTRFLDIRTFVDGQKWKGYTRKGNNLSASEVEALFAQETQIRQAMGLPARVAAAA